MADAPAVSVVVASHARALRLRWLLNALEEQTLPRERWELVVAHDYDEETAARVLGDHPLAAAGTLRQIPLGGGTGAAEKRNLGWRAAAAPLVAFTDDDCRPDPAWLEALLSVAGESPGAVVQGRVRPDPLEQDALLGPHAHTVHVEPVSPYAETANIAYPRALLERVGGFDEAAGVGEDAGLALRARAAGAEVLAAPAALVHHAVESQSLRTALRRAFTARHLAYFVKRHPEFRRELELGVFWNRTHLELTAALAGVAGARRHRGLLVLAAPYLARAAVRRGRGPKALAIALGELPGNAARELAEVAGMAAGSVRHRTFLL